MAPPEVNYLQYLANDEAEKIIQKFRSPAFLPDRQVLWSGLHREQAQQWADKRRMQTLTTAMGPLMKLEQTPKHGQSNYIKGASILFAQQIAKGESVVVLCAPPPTKFHPTGLTNYQSLEEPVLMGRLESKPMFRIYMCHPTVVEAEDYCYEAWPNDNTHEWVGRYASLTLKAHIWRQIPCKVSVPKAQMSLKSKSESICLFERPAAPRKTQQTTSKQQSRCEHGVPLIGKEHDKANVKTKKSGEALKNFQKAGETANLATEQAGLGEKKKKKKAKKSGKKANKAALIKKITQKANKAIKKSKKATKAAKKARKAKQKLGSAATKKSTA